LYILNSYHAYFWSFLFNTTFQNYIIKPGVSLFSLYAHVHVLNFEQNIALFLFVMYPEFLNHSIQTLVSKYLNIYKKEDVHLNHVNLRHTFAALCSCVNMLICSVHRQYSSYVISRIQYVKQNT